MFDRIAKLKPWYYFFPWGIPVPIILLGTSACSADAHPLTCQQSSGLLYLHPIAIILFACGLISYEKRRHAKPLGTDVIDKTFDKVETVVTTAQGLNRKLGIGEAIRLFGHFGVLGVFFFAEFFFVSYAHPWVKGPYGSLGSGLTFAFSLGLIVFCFILQNLFFLITYTKSFLYVRAGYYCIGSSIAIIGAASGIRPYFTPDKLSILLKTLAAAFVLSAGGYFALKAERKPGPEARIISDHIVES